MSNNWYKDDYLQSEWWERLKKRAIRKYGYECSIKNCQKRTDLELHHLDYTHRGEREELKDVVFLCSVHHMLCHFSFLGFYKIPLKRKNLTKRYREIQRRFWGRWRPSTILAWLERAYGI